MSEVHITRMVFGNWNSVYKKKPALCGAKLKTTVYATANESAADIEQRLDRLAASGLLCESRKAAQSSDLLEKEK